MPGGARRAQREIEGRAPVHNALGPYPAAVALGDAFHRRGCRRSRYCSAPFYLLPVGEPSARLGRVEKLGDIGGAHGAR